jgi:hypothetical protein
LEAVGTPASLLSFEIPKDIDPGTSAAAAGRAFEKVAVLTRLFAITPKP